MNLPDEAASSTPLLLVFFLIITATLPVLVYLFYPALVAALEPNLQPCRVQVLKTSNANTANDTLSIIIPAYNEQDRLVLMLQEAVDYFAGRRTTISSSSQTTKAPKTNNIVALQALHCSAVEWILVSDGSTDDTERVYTDFVQTLQTTTTNINNHTWKLLVLPKNMGKGAAVRIGMLQATGSWRLFVDADGATLFGTGLEALCDFASSHSVIIGSRAHLLQQQHDTTTTSTSTHRNIVRQALMYGFHWCCRCVVQTSIQDTQCGFKLFSSQAAQQVFGALHLRRWAFDIEVVYLVNHVFCCLPIKEVPVAWQEVPGSKLHTSALNLLLVAMSMLRDMICVRLCYRLKLWNVPPQQQQQHRRRRDKKDD
jgi:dolichyl-phosphate beta-glucosyltransferase